MTDINTLLTDFFVNVGDIVQAPKDPSALDVEITSATLPPTDSGILATALIDGANYFKELKNEIAALLAGGTDRFFYTNSWALGTSPTPGIVPIGEGTFTSAWQADAKKFAGSQNPFQLEDGTTGPFHPFQDDIKAMSDAGVDVRLLVWASHYLVNLEQFATAGNSFTMQYWAVNVHSLRSILDLRQIPSMSQKIVVNTLAHTLGAMHLKMVICGDSTGFRGYVGGIDFTQIRNAIPRHHDIPGHFNKWHDVMIKVEGTTANPLYHTFELLWNEEVKRSAKKFKAFGKEIKSHVDGTPLVNPRQTGPIIGGTCHTQVLRTIPTMNFSFFKTDRAPVRCYERLIVGFKQKKFSFAEDGIFEFRAALLKAVNHAQQYIYIEDQAMENLELANWINRRLHEELNLKVMMVCGGDPLDPPWPERADMIDIMIDSIASPEDRIVFLAAPYITHGKLTIIDDVWASIGSSNCWRRSFYLDGEINVSVIDDPAPNTPSFAARLRKDLWGELCDKIPGPACDPLLPLDKALGIWRSSWGTAPTGFNLRTDLVPKAIPFVFTSPPVPKEDFPEPRPALTTDQRDQQDGDSRLEY